MIDFRQTAHGIAITGAAAWFGVHAYGPQTGAPQFAPGAQVSTIENFRQPSGNAPYWRWSGSASGSRTVIQMTRGGEYDLFMPGRADAAVRIPAWSPGDWDFSGRVNSADISAFLTTWMQSVTEQSIDADFDLNNEVNSADISSFIQSWLAQ